MDVLHAELRENGSGQFAGVVIAEGRIAADRSELFAPGSVMWPEAGIDILAEHRGKRLATATAERRPNGEIAVTAEATPELRAAVLQKRFMSIEFRALREQRTGSTREVLKAYVDRAALVEVPAYSQTRAEIRAGSHRMEIWQCLADS